MTQDRDRKDLDAFLLPPLDAEPGPMPPLSAAESDALAWGAVSRWAAGLPGVEPADDGVGPAKPLTAADAAQLAERVVALQAARSRGPLWPSWAVKAAALVLACGFSAVSFAAYRHWLAAPAPVQVDGRATQLRAAQAGRATSVPERVSPSAVLSASERPVGRGTPPTAVAPLEPTPSAAPTEMESTPTAAVPASKPARAAQGAVQPAELLARANALRAQRRWAAAERLYRQAIGAGASSDQRYVALVASASINLQHLGKPARALAAYQSALALSPRGDLSEEALLGVADCQRALGQRALERRALDTFTHEHPDSPWIDAVQRRRSALE